MWLIEWFDAHDGPMHWSTPDDAQPERVTVQSVGFLLDAAPGADHVTLVTSDDGVHVSGGIHIPVVNVLSRRRLR